MDNKFTQDKLFEAMKVIDKICSQNDINYMLSWGTALGAVRHKGFIPWDDDVDISMLYNDYIRFVDICKKEGILPEGYIIQTHDTEVRYPFLFAKIRNTSVNVKERCFEGLGIQEGLWVDIFPAINVSENAILEKLQRVMIYIGNWLCHKYYFLNQNQFVRENNNYLGIKKVIFKCLPDKILNFLIKLTTKIVLICGDESSQYVTDVEIANKFLKVPRSVYENCKYMQFESYNFLVSEEADTYLTLAYGDYMTPVKYGHDTI